MEWLRSILTGQGIENADAIIAEVQKTLPLHFVPKSVFNAKSDEVKALQDKIDKAPDYDGLKKQYDELQTKYDTDTNKLKGDLEGRDRTHAIDLAISKSGAKNAKALKALSYQFISP